MASSEIALELVLTEPGADAERLDDLTRRLTSSIHELGVESVERPAGDAAPEGAKGEPFTWGALAIAVAPTLVSELIKLLQAWVQQGAGRTVKIKTAEGLEVEFVPGRDLDGAELASLVKELRQAGHS